MGSGNVTPVVIGIAGGTASGKSTLAQALAGTLGGRCHLLLHDRYYRAPSGDPAAHNFDHPDALDTPALIADIDALKRGESVTLPLYDFATHQPRVDTETLAPREVLIVEGILILESASLRERLDHAVFVHTPADIRLMRRVRRDIADRGRTVEGVFSQYARTVRPMHEHHVEPSRVHADLTLDGTEPVQALVDRLWDWGPLQPTWRESP
jgi:uridine kinase